MNFAIEYLCENEKFRETVFACSYGAQVESSKQKNGQKSRDTVPLSLSLKRFVVQQSFRMWVNKCVAYTVCSRAVGSIEEKQYTVQCTVYILV